MPLSAEVALLESYLALEHYRFAAGFDYSVVQDVAGDATIAVTPLVWHAAVEQALFGQLLQGSAQGMLRITFTLDGGEPTCIVHAKSAKRNEESTAVVSEQKLRLTL